jgi:hypothetical protein
VEAVPTQVLEGSPAGRRLGPAAMLWRGSERLVPQERYRRRTLEALALVWMIGDVNQSRLVTGSGPE